MHLLIVISGRDSEGVARGKSQALQPGATKHSDGGKKHLLLPLVLSCEVQPGLLARTQLLSHTGPLLGCMGCLSPPTATTTTTTPRAGSCCSVAPNMPHRPWLDDGVLARRKSRTVSPRLAHICFLFTLRSADLRRVEVPRAGGFSLSK